MEESFAAIARSLDRPAVVIADRGAMRVLCLFAIGLLFVRGDCGLGGVRLELMI